MTRLYLKIFFTFWIITALIIVSTNVLVHWFDLAPEPKLHKHRHDQNYEPARRLCFRWSVRPSTAIPRSSSTT